MSTNATTPFDPYTQSFTWYDAYNNPFVVTMGDLSLFTSQNISLGLVYGAQVGLAALMLFTLLLLTQPGKRRSPIFILNTVALTLDLLRGVMMAVWLGSMWNNVYGYFSNDSSKISRTDIADSVVAEVFKCLEVIVIMVSLIFQVRVILSTATQAQRFLVLCVSVLVALITISIDFAALVVNAQNIAAMAYPSDGSLQQRLANAAGIAQLVAVAFFLIVFSSKLGIAICQRYRLGQSKFGPMQMVFIGSLQSMVLPSKYSRVRFAYSY